jgi:purine-binding chemotaxis protein CheW
MHAAQDTIGSGAAAKTPPVNGADPSEAGAVRQCLTFVCAGEEYGIDILRVQEIKGWSEVTRVPRTPSYMLGVMNLRGVIVPVIDLRQRFGLQPRPHDGSTVVVVVRVQLAAGGGKTVGIVVDGVSEVCDFALDAIMPPPRAGGRVDQACVSGLATAGERMVSLVDIDALVAGAIADI